MYNVSSNANITCVYSSNSIQYISKKKTWKTEIDNLLFLECDKFINKNVYFIFSKEIWITTYTTETTQATLPLLPITNLKFIKFLYTKGISTQFLTF
jgi:hypothetical protein